MKRAIDFCYTILIGREGSFRYSREFVAVWTLMIMGIVQFGCIAMGLRAYAFLVALVAALGSLVIYAIYPGFNYRNDLQRYNQFQWTIYYFLLIISSIALFGISLYGSFILIRK